MKKLLVLLLCLCFCLPNVAKACDKKDDVSFFVSSHQYTADATVLTFGKYCIVGVRTKGILRKSDATKYFDDIKQGIVEIAPEYTNVYVTNDLQEVVVIKDVSKKMNEGMGALQIYNYVKQKYPNAIDKIISGANI